MADVLADSEIYGQFAEKATIKRVTENTAKGRKRHQLYTNYGDFESLKCLPFRFYCEECGFI